MKVDIWFIQEDIKCKLTSVNDLKVNCEVVNRLYGRRPCTLRLQDKNTCFEVDFDSNETGESVVVK